MTSHEFVQLVGQSSCMVSQVFKAMADMMATVQANDGAITAEGAAVLMAEQLRTEIALDNDRRKDVQRVSLKDIGTTGKEE